MKLALFPLNTVLFPGMTLPLHVFEPRYREMINGCLHERQPFGVVLIRSGQEVGGPAEPHAVGTYGAISRVERLPDGRMNIEVVGQERFRILQLHRDLAYLTGTVEKFPLLRCEAAHAQRSARAIAPWLKRYLQLLADASETSFDGQKLPRHPDELAYLAAIIAQIPMREKQALLSIPSAVELLERERAIYRREIALLQAMLSSPQACHNPDISPN
jgi:Lon protease-like protein